MRASMRLARVVCSGRSIASSVVLSDVDGSPAASNSATMLNNVAWPGPRSVISYDCGVLDNPFVGDCTSFIVTRGEAGTDLSLVGLNLPKS